MNLVPEWWHEKNLLFFLPSFWAPVLDGICFWLHFGAFGWSFGCILGTHFGMFWVHFGAFLVLILMPFLYYILVRFLVAFWCVFWIHFDTFWVSILAHFLYTFLHIFWYHFGAFFGTILARFLDSFWLDF